jgi:hypothetical protein
MKQRFAYVMFAACASYLQGCASGTFTPTLSSAITQDVAQKIAVGQTRAQIEAHTRQRPNPFTYALRPDVRFQAWPFADAFEQKCLMVTYDRSDTAIEVAVLVKDRGPFAMPLPAGC